MPKEHVLYHAPELREGVCLHNPLVTFKATRPLSVQVSEDGTQREVSVPLFLTPRSIFLVTFRYVIGNGLLRHSHSFCIATILFELPKMNDVQETSYGFYD